jgi:hypothetical protein
METMSKALFAALFLTLTICLFRIPASADSPPMVFKSLNFDLPFGDRMFPDGTNSDAINNNCLACHSAGMVLTQPPMSRQAWTAEVEKMRNAYKAPIADQDVAPIVDYLVATRGMPRGD